MSRFDYPGVAHQLFENTAYPSWLFARDPDDNTIGVSWASGSSHGRPNQGRSIQYRLGSAGAWFFDCLGGIEPDFAAPAFKHFTLRPMPAPQLASAAVEHDTPHGTIGSAWKREGEKTRWSFTIPPNTTAAVMAPGSVAKGFRAGQYEIDVLSNNP